MEVIVLEEEAFYSLIEEVVKRLKGDNEGPGDKWIQTEDAMRMLGVKSKTTMQNLRDEGRIRFAQPQKRIILYDRDSINEYLEKHAKETF